MGHDLPTSPLTPELLRACQSPLERTLLAELGAVADVDLLVRGQLGAMIGAIADDVAARGLRLDPRDAPQLLADAGALATRLGQPGPVDVIVATDALVEALAPLVLGAPMVGLPPGGLAAQDERGRRALVAGAIARRALHGRGRGDGASGATIAAALVLAGRGDLDPALRRRAARLVQVAQLGIDRAAALATGDVDGALAALAVRATSVALPPGWDAAVMARDAVALVAAALAPGAPPAALAAAAPMLRPYALAQLARTPLLPGAGGGAAPLELAALDDELARLVDLLAPTVGSLGPSPAEAPAELYAAALAAATLVAQADGELSDDELLAIERVFAAAVPDFRARLERTHALAELPRSGLVVAAHGPVLLRALFDLVLAVLVADGVAAPRELATMRGVGEALGAGALFDAWLAPALRARGLDTTALGEAREPLPLAPRAGEAQAALATYCAGLAARGGGRTTLRRLLALLGGGDDSAPSAATLAQLASALTSAGLRARAPLDPRALDAALWLDGPPPTLATTARPAPALPADQAALRRAIMRLRDDLVSGDGRSPSVRVREVRKGRTFDLASLDRVAVGAGERTLAQLRGGKAARLVTASEIGTHEPSRAVAAELVELHREHRARLEETGADDLWLGYPMLTGMADGYLYRGPLLLYSVDLVRDDEGARGFRLAPRDGDEPIVNQSLLRLVFHKLGFALPEAKREELDALAADEAQGPEAVIAALGELGLPAVTLTGKLGPLRNRDAELEGKARHCEIEECAVLGLFPQSGSDLLQDYDALIDELGAPGAPLGELLGAARELLPATLRAAAAGPPAPPTVAGSQPVQPAIAADPSQRAVLAEARTAPALVVDGPPGTGKSQVIANLVVDALSRGEQVAVVCEKRAALDVVAQRLGTLGLTRALAVVHDVAFDRKALYAQLATRLETPPTAAPDAGKHAQVAAQASAAEAELQARADALAQRPPGSALSLGQLYTLAAGLDAPTLRLVNDPSLLTDVQLAAVHELLVTVWPHLDLVGPGGAVREPGGQRRRPPLAELDDAALAELAQALGVAADRADELATVSAGGASIADVVAAGDALDALAAGASARATSDGAAWFGRLAAADAAGARREVRTAVDGWQASRGSALAVITPMTQAASPTLERSVELVRAWAGRFLRFFAIAWWRARGAVKRGLATYWPDKAGHPLAPDVLDGLVARLAAARGWAALRGGLGALPGAVVPDLVSDADAFAERLAGLARGADALVAQRAALQAVGLDVDGFARDRAGFETTLATRLRQREAARALEAALAPTRARLPWLDATSAASTLRALRDVLVRDGARLRSVERALAAARATVPSAPALVDELVDAAAAAAPGDLACALRAVRRAHAVATIAAVERRDAAAGQLADPLALAREARLGDELATLEEARAAALVERVRAALDAGTLAQTRAARPRARRTSEQATREAMLKETKKQRRIMPLRTFVRRFAGEGLLELAPVWLLSPETMAILFPRQPLFDLVIFDEASQCTVESGVPVLLRAQRVVIAGDDKQMPPTSFFTATPDDGDVADVADGADAALDPRDLLDDESLLTLAQGRVPRRRLLWHYRCKHESLIAFSNHAMYDGQLRTIPSTSSPSAPAALRWHAVTGASYAAGRNPTEAEAVVDVLDERLRRTPAPTLGVVTFNLEQRATIHEAIDARRTRDPDFARRWDAACAAEAVDRQPFIKNLESVQGDERDVIIFSLGHAPVARTRARRAGASETYVPARFGPLGQRGGERRLNVAISRAKAECVVVASFEPSQLSVSSSKHLGPALLRQYLEFAFHSAAGRHLEAAQALRAAGASRSTAVEAPAPLPCEGYQPLATQVRAALASRGLAADADVGTSSFRVPVAVVHPGDPARYCVAVLTDEGAPDPATAQAPLERFVHRPGVLRQRGFDVVRVTAAEWYARREGVLDAIATRVAAASAPR
jgi:hypothetical protein